MYRYSVGDLHSGTYKKLMAAMVDAVVMYGPKYGDAWEVCR